MDKDEIIEGKRVNRLYKNEDTSTYDIFLARVNNASRVLLEFKEKCRRNNDFYRGFQIPNDIADDLHDEDRPTNVFNYILSVVNSVTGSEQTNRFTFKAEPRQVGAQQSADMINGTVRYLRDNTDSEFQESDAFQDTIIQGMGILRFSQDYSETHEGRTRVDVQSVYNYLWDPFWRYTNMTDRRWDASYDWWPLEDCKARWPQHTDDLESLMRSGSGDSRVSEDGSFSGFVGTDGTSRWVNRDLDELLVYRYNYRVLEYYWLVHIEAIPEDPQTGAPAQPEQKIEMTVEEYKRFRKQIQDEIDAGLNPELEQPFAVQLDRNVYHEAFFTGTITLEDEMTRIQNDFLTKIITCFKHKKEDVVDVFGLVDVMEDPQMFANQMLNQLTHIVNTNPKGALLAEETALIDFDKAMTDWARPNSVIKAADGAVQGKRIEVLRSVYPESQDKLYNMAVEAVTRVIGFSPYQLNAVENLSRTNQAAFRMVQQNSQVMLSQPFDALKLYRKNSGRTYVEFIDAFMQEGQLIRIQSNSAPTEIVPFKREWIDGVEFDIVFDQSPATATAAEELWDSLTQHGGMEMLSNMGVLTPIMVINMMPGIPETQRNEMRMEAQKKDVMGQAIQMASSGKGAQALSLLQGLAEDQGIEEQQGAEA